MKKLLLLDLDGTCREPASGEKFIQHPLAQRVIDGADRALAHCHEQGWKIVGISNQGGCRAINTETGRPYKILEDALAESTQ